MYLLSRTVYSTPFYRDAIVSNFRQRLVYNGSRPASCCGPSTFTGRSTTATKSNSNRKKLIILQYSCPAQIMGPTGEIKKKLKNVKCLPCLAFCLQSNAKKQMLSFNITFCFQGGKKQGTVSENSNSRRMRDVLCLF